MDERGFQDPDFASVQADLPFTRLHLAVAALCAVGFAIDLMEIAMGGALSAVFAVPPYNLGGVQLAWLTSAVYAGAVFGAPLMGWVADRIGLRLALTGLALWLAATSLMAAASPTPGCLTVSRLLGGVALGAYPPLMIAYLTDLMPPRRRGLVVFWVCAAGYLAPPVVIFVIRWLTPIQPLGIEGWRWPLGGGAVLALGLAYGFSRLPEGPDWLMAKGRFGDARAVLARLDASSRLRLAAPSGRHPLNALAPASPGLAAAPLASRRLAIVGAIYFLIPWATVAFPLLIGPILLARRFSLSDTLFYVGIATLGPVLGTTLAGLAADRLDKRRFMAAAATLMTGCVLLFLFVPHPAVMAASVVLFGLGSSVFMPAMVLYGAASFSAEVRGRATSLAWMANRAAAAGAPVVLLAVLGVEEPLQLAAVMGLTLTAIVGLLLSAPKEGL